MIAAKWLPLFLRVVGATSLLAFLAAVMPASWIVEIAEAIGFSPFPAEPITFYLARNLSLLYGFVGCLLLGIANDLVRYRTAVTPLAIAIVAFGFLQALVDTQSAMPVWWTALEAGSTVAGGVILLWLDRWTEWTDVDE